MISGITSKYQQVKQAWKTARSHQDPMTQKSKASQPKGVEDPTFSEKNYFTDARCWADDLYTHIILSRNRYKCAFFIAMGLTILLTVAVDGLIPLQHIEPLLIHHYPDGRVSVQPVQQHYTPTNPVEVQSELVRYVMNRESYDATSYASQYSLIHLLSSPAVSQGYRADQSTDNKMAPINLLGNHGFRTVAVDSVVFLDTNAQNKGKPRSQQTHHNLAQVNFTITDHFSDSAQTKTHAFTALLSWEYRGTPHDPNERWRNWDGFTATRYTVEQRNVE